MEAEGSTLSYNVLTKSEAVRAMTQGRKTGGGSRKGRPNKITRDVRETIIHAFYEAGGSAYLQKQAKKNPAAFLSLLGRTLPKDIRAEITVTLEKLIEESRGPHATVIEHQPSHGFNGANGAAEIVKAVVESEEKDDE